MNAQFISKHVELKELGLSFDIPDGWSGQVEGDYILLSHTAIPGLMALSTNTSKSVMELQQLAEQGIVEAGVHLVANGDFTVINQNRLEGMYKGTFNGQQVKAHAIGLISSMGHGVNIIILAEPDKLNEQHKTAANTLASSVTFYKSEDNQATGFWKKKLMGKQLYFGLTRGSGSDTKIIDLCGDGSFYYYARTHIAFDEIYGQGSANRNTNTMGNYTIYSTDTASSFLELVFDNGEVYVYALTTNDAGNTFLDNSRYYVQNSERCN